LVAAIELRMLRQDSIITGFQLAQPNFLVALGDVVPGATIACAAVIGSPMGTAFSIAARIPFKLSGRSRALRLVCTAIMPQPISTPTAAGQIEPRLSQVARAAAAPLSSDQLNVRLQSDLAGVLEVPGLPEPTIVIHVGPIGSNRL
jgi:hypothetical protein